MKNHKLFLPAIILVVAVLAISVCCVLLSVAYKPTVTEAEFPFSITYEYNGETVTIEDVYTVRYDGNDGDADTKSRIYVGKIGNMAEEDVDYTILEVEGSLLLLNTNFYPDYLMGDSEYDYFDGGEFAPEFVYYGVDGFMTNEAEYIEGLGAKIMDFEYPEPIENSLVFSHISIMSGETVVGPMVLITLLALLAVILFVKKDADLAPQLWNTVSLVMNVIVAVVAVPFLAIISVLVDMTGENNNILSQSLYFTAALTVLGIAASVALRRKGYRKSGFAVQFVGPALFMLIYVIALMSGMA